MDNNHPALQATPSTHADAPMLDLAHGDGEAVAPAPHDAVDISSDALAAVDAAAVPARAARAAKKAENARAADEKKAKQAEAQVKRALAQAARAAADAAERVLDPEPTPAESVSNGPPPSSTPAAMPPPRAAPPAPENVWSHHAEARGKANKAVRDDVGLHRPSMAALQPLLDLVAAGETSGRVLFETFENIHPTVARPIVTTVRMDTGYATNQLTEKSAIAAVLHCRVRGIERSLADLVQLKIDTDARQLVWGLASFEAAAALENMQFRIPTKDGTQSFAMVSAHVLDGFHVEIVGFNVDRDSRAHLWEVLSRCGAVPISGQYTTASKMYGTTGSRYRVSFQGADVPAIFKKDGRFLDELVFMGKLYRVYPKGWFAHRDRRFVRGDLDQHARDMHVPRPDVKSHPSPTAARPTAPAKRQKVSTATAPWTTVLSKSNALDGAGKPRSWTSPNMYDALQAHVTVTTKLVSSADGADRSIVPVVSRRSDAPASVAAHEFVGGTKTHAHKVLRVETPLSELLDEFDALDRAATAHAADFEQSCQAAVPVPKFDLAHFIRAGEADWLQRDLEAHPISFRRQLRDLALVEPALLLQLVQLRMMCRWLRAAHGSSDRFHVVYEKVHGHPYSSAVFAADFAALCTNHRLINSVDPEESGKGDATPLAAEGVVALAELVLGSLAPHFYAHDAALYAITAEPIFSIPSRTHGRYLASATICSVLWGDSLLGRRVRDEVASLLAAGMEAAAHAVSLVLGTDDASMTADDPTWAALLDSQLCLRHMDMLHAFGDACLQPDTQVMYDASAGLLVHGDLTELWSELPDPAVRC